MSFSESASKIFFHPSHMKTPNTKEKASSSERKDDIIYNPPILMDEFGQTPDHFYLARKPPSCFQVKRKLNLQSTPQSSTESIHKPTRRRRKTDIKPKVKLPKARYDTSLGQLTKKFLKLLTDASDGVINLNTASTLLSVKKRRLYDITNVLEGAGLIQKTSRNNIQWMGRMSACYSSAVMYDLEKDIDILEAKENKLDELIYHMKSEIKTLKETEDCYLYITSDDLRNVEDFSTNSIVGVKLASGEQIIEPSERKVYITSKTTELAAFLVSEEVSFLDILHPGAEFKDDSYKVKISNKHILDFIAEQNDSDSDCLVGYGKDSTFAQLCAEAAYNEGFNGSPYSRNASGSGTEDEEDIAPLSRNFLLQTEDQDLNLPFPDLELEDSYYFSLDADEGLTDLYDCKFSCP